MTKFAIHSGLVLAAALLASACSKESAPEKTQPAAEPAPVAAAVQEQPAPAAAADYIKIYGAHEPRTPADPVEITIEQFTVKSATFDPENLEGGVVELELDLASIKSDKDKRDGHLKSADYLDVASFGTATIKIENARRDTGDSYVAQAEITAHGVTKTVPVKFSVVEKKDGAIRVQGEHTFSRLDFSIGKEPDGENEKVAVEVTIKMLLTLKSS